MNKFGLIEWMCQHGVQTSWVHYSTESVNVALVQISFTLPLSYSYGVAVESIGIADSNDATLAYYDDHFQTHTVSEKGTYCNENIFMSICLAIIID